MNDLRARKFLRGPSDSEASVIFGKGATSAKLGSARDHLKCRSSETLEGRYPMLNSKTPLLASVLAALLGVGATLGVQNHESVRKVSEVKLPNVPGQTLTAEVVEYPPGGKSGVHHHAGSVFAYILTGRIRSQTSATGPARVYKAGETFFEPPGSDHLVSENASTTEPASLLAIIIAEDGAFLTKPGNTK